MSEQGQPFVEQWSNRRPLESVLPRLQTYGDAVQTVEYLEKQHLVEVRADEAGCFWYRCRTDELAAKEALLHSRGFKRWKRERVTEAR